MKINYNNDFDTSFNMASMADIMTIILIFFMLMISTNTNKQIVIDLPVVNNDFVQVSKTDLIIKIDKNNIMYIDENAIPNENIRSTIIECSRNKKKINLMVDKNIVIDKLLKVIDIADSLKIPIVISAIKNNLNV